MKVLGKTAQISRIFFQMTFVLLVVLMLLLSLVVLDVQRKAEKVKCDVEERCAQLEVSLSLLTNLHMSLASDLNRQTADMANQIVVNSFDAFLKLISGSVQATEWLLEAEFRRFFCIFLTVYNLLPSQFNVRFDIPSIPNVPQPPTLPPVFSNTYTLSIPNATQEMIDLIQLPASVVNSTLRSSLPTFQADLLPVPSYTNISICSSSSWEEYDRIVQSVLTPCYVALGVLGLLLISYIVISIYYALKHSKKEHDAYLFLGIFRVGGLREKKRRLLWWLNYVDNKPIFALFFASLILMIVIISMIILVSRAESLMQQTVESSFISPLNQSLQLLSLQIEGEYSNYTSLYNQPISSFQQNVSQVFCSFQTQVLWLANFLQSKENIVFDAVKQVVGSAMEKLAQNLLTCAFFFLDLPYFLQQLAESIPNISLPLLPPVPQLSLDNSTISVSIRNIGIKMCSITKEVKSSLYTKLWFCVALCGFSFLPIIFSLLGIAYHIKKNNLKDREEPYSEINSAQKTESLSLNFEGVKVEQSGVVETTLHDFEAIDSQFRNSKVSVGIEEKKTKKKSIGKGRRFLSKSQK